MNMLEKILGGIKSVGRFVDRPAQLANQRDAQINEQIRLSIMENDPELYRMLYLPQITDEEQIMRQLDGYYDYEPQGPSYGSGFGA